MDMEKMEAKAVEMAETAYDKHPHLIKFFAWAHLPERLQQISKPFGELAVLISNTLPANPEAEMALRKLLEAKDCAVRAVLP